MTDKQTLFAYRLKQAEETLSEKHLMPDRRVIIKSLLSYRMKMRLNMLRSQKISYGGSGSRCQGGSGR